MIAQPAEDDGGRDLGVVDDPARDGFGHLDGQERADEVEDRRQRDRRAGLESTGGDGGGHGVGRVVEPVGEVEDESSDDNDDHYKCGIHTDPPAGSNKVSDR